MMEWRAPLPSDARGGSLCRLGTMNGGNGEELIFLQIFLSAFLNRGTNVPSKPFTSDGPWRDRHDRKIALAGAIMPEDAVSLRRLILSVGLKNLFTTRPPDRRILMGLQSRMTEICLHVSQRFSDGL